MSGALHAVTVLELAGLGPGPFAAMWLADMGAHVLRVERPGSGPPRRPPETELLNRGRPSITLDLKDPAAVEVVAHLVNHADVLLEGFRPGVAERLGLGPEQLCARNPRLVYGRVTGWGQDGPLAPAVGHDINYAALSGALGAIGPSDRPPVPPLNLVADFGGGGMLLVAGVLAALLERERSGVGQVVDAAMVDGVALLTTMIRGFVHAGEWTGARGENLLDGGAPFYRTYACADGGHVAVGAIEPPFYDALVTGLTRVESAVTDGLPPQMDRDHWPQTARRFAVVFAQRTRDEWVDVFAGTDACVTPVLSLAESEAHPHLLARQTFVPAPTPGAVQPAPAPRLSRTPGRIAALPLSEALEAWGLCGEVLGKIIT